MQLESYMQEQAYSASKNALQKWEHVALWIIGVFKLISGSAVVVFITA